MTKIIGLIAAIAVAMWTIGNFGGLFGLTKDEELAIANYKNQAIDRAVPVLSPVVTKQDVLNVEQKINQAMPTPAEVKSTIETKIIPAIVKMANKLGNAAQHEISKAPTYNDSGIYSQHVEIAEPEPLPTPPQEQDDQQPPSNSLIYKQ